MLYNTGTCSFTCSASGFRVAAAAGGGSGSHTLGVCFLAAGVYHLQVYDVVVVSMGTAAEGLSDSKKPQTIAPFVSVHSLHVLVQ